MHRRQLARDDPGCERKSAADRSVEALADDVDLPVVEVPVGQHARIALEESAEERDEEVAAECLAHAHLQRAGRVLAPIAEAGNGRLQRRKRAVDLLQEALSAFGQAQAPRAAVEQADAEIAFEARHVLADAGRRQAEHPGGGREAAVLRRLRERDQVLHVRHAAILNRGLKVNADVAG